jgi:hypothetical protein
MVTCLVLFFCSGILLKRDFHNSCIGISLYPLQTFLQKKYWEGAVKKKHSYPLQVNTVHKKMIFKMLQLYCQKKNASIVILIVIEL